MQIGPNATMDEFPFRPTTKEHSMSSSKDSTPGDSAYASRTTSNTTTDNLLSDNENQNAYITADSRKRTISDDDSHHCPVSAPKRRVNINVKPPPLVHPRWYYEGYPYMLPISDEGSVRKEFIADAEIDESGNAYFLLDDFNLYHTEQSNRRPMELVPLNTLNVARASDSLHMDGVLSNGTEKRYLQRILVNTLSLEYEDISDQKDSPKIWIKSCYNSGNSLGVDVVDIWYELGKPALEYARYYKPFLWLARFAKYFADYLETKVEGCDKTGTEGGQDVRIENFRSDFARWLKSSFGGMSSFEAWYTQYGKDDFRMAISAHRDWLWNQAHGITLPNSKLRQVTLWDEILHLKAIKPAPGPLIDKTVVTPYVYSCFENLFTTKLKVCAQPQLNQEFVGVFIPPKSKFWTDEHGNYLTGQYSYPKLGDVVAFEKDEVTKWRSTGDHENLWFGYVTGITPNKSMLKIIWLYKPNDTVLCGPNGEYPNKKELFFSDHCNCQNTGSALLTKDIVGVLSVKFFADPEDKDAEYFVRMKYITNDPGFLTLQKSDLSQCACMEEDEDHFSAVKSKYRSGSTVLLADIDRGVLEPVVIHKFYDESKTISVRLLERYTHAQPNELVYTIKFEIVQPELIIRRCRVRIFLRDEPIFTPYDRSGTGDCFYIRNQRLDNETIIPLLSHPSEEDLCQGFSPTTKTPVAPLRGLDLFCGGGNFGRGLEEGGAVQMKWAVDIESAPLHSYRANLESVDSTALYLGSINNYLKDAIKGNYSDTVAAKGEVEFISAGSPCQGFSNANGQKNSEKSIQNCSLVSTLATAIDVYRPQYALLENVAGLATTRTVGDRQCNVFSALLCCIVGMGYQCQQFILDSWSHGNPQTRTRLFLAVSAPGNSPLTRPPRSHRHPDDQKALGLYKAPNGLTFGTREMEGLCPFNLRTAGECFEYLPDIHDDHVGICIPYPDHHCSREEGPITRKLLAHIPCYPEKQGWYSTIMRGRLDRSLWPYSLEKEKSRPNCKSWQRIPETGLCRTITTTLTPQCSRTGQWVHYKQPRLLSIQEARIAQGFPDEEVLIGEPTRRFKIVGNSVARGVSLAMGLALRRAYFDD